MWLKLDKISGNLPEDITTSYSSQLHEITLKPLLTVTCNATVQKNTFCISMAGFSVLITLPILHINRQFILHR